MRLKHPLFAALAVCAFVNGAAAGDALSPHELRRLAPGRYAVNVMGMVNMTVQMRPNGTITGQMKGEKDRGSWSVRGQQLCIVWTRWVGGRTRCAALTGDKGSYRGGGLSIRRI